MAHVEKDRTGILAGHSIDWPTFEAVARPLLGLLGTTQAALPSDEEVGWHDAESLARQEWERQQRAAELAEQFMVRLRQAETVAALQQVGKELTSAVKRRLVSKDLERVRRAYAERLAKLKLPRGDQPANGGTNERGEGGGAPDAAAASVEPAPSGA